MDILQRFLFLDRNTNLVEGGTNLTRWIGWGVVRCILRAFYYIYREFVLFLTLCSKFCATEKKKRKIAGVGETRPKKKKVRNGDGIVIIVSW